MRAPQQAGPGGRGSGPCPRFRERHGAHPARETIAIDDRMLSKTSPQEGLGAGIKARKERAVGTSEGQGKPPPETIVDVLRPIAREQIPDETQVQTQGR